MYMNSERFITSFTRIEKRLQSIINNGRNIGFSKMVRMLKNTDPIVGQYSDDLLEFAELRNAIVHNRVELRHTIAEPHDTAVQKIERIERELLEPRKVNPQFIKKVISFEESEPLSHLLAVMYDKKVTKFPIYDKHEFKGLLTQRAVAFWLANSMYKGYTMPSDISVKEVLSYEKNDNYRFIQEDTSVLEAKDIFNKQYRIGNRLEALLITKNGNASEELLGIITNLDMIGLQ